MLCSGERARFADAGAQHDAARASGELALAQSAERVDIDPVSLSGVRSRRSSRTKS